MPRSRFTVKGTMIATAIFGTVLGVLHERRARFLKIAVTHEEWSRPWVLYPGFFTPPRAMWSIAMQVKYQHAARYPWLPVLPDPPRPDGGRLPYGDALWQPLQDPTDPFS